MRALIVDDEKHVRSAVRKLIDWRELGFREVIEAEDGAEAVRLIEERRPQLVVTDIMMPLASGIELMAWMEKHAADCKKIVISGFNDFEFVRHTVKYGGIDYLLKPIDRKQLLDAVSKAAASWQETERGKRQLQAKSMEVNELKPMYRDKLLSRLLAETSYGRAPAPGEHYLREFSALADIRTCQVAAFDLKSLPEHHLRKYAPNPDLLFFSLLNICNDFLHPSGQGTAFRNWNSPYEIVLLIWDEPDRTAAWLRKIADGIGQTLQVQAEFGVSQPRPFPAGLHQAYVQALGALNRRNLLESSSPIHEYQPDAPSVGTLRFGKFEEKIRLAVRSGHAGQIRQSVGEWGETVSAMERITMEQLKWWWDEYTVARAGWIEDFFQECREAPRMPAENGPFVLPLDERGRFSLPVLQERLIGQLIELAQIMASLQAPGGSPMREIARYLELHYMKEITLQDISSKFHLNREYISRRFKQEFGETIGDFTSRVRMDKAKTLLASPHLKIAQIALMVGYQDEKYFSRVFKKVEQMSPNDYRKKLAEAERNGG
ncbi:response regulator [Cohnella sp. REN36]|uniref:response regulator transcription factor n=1 Tax=Cohnella sp. REN36 TaxID=2887347 RepID=UPI001D14019A|nr:response regulator [Cohnella sp. REN36]MCC3375305.1 response regulator [Cohnella sp. REN36]